MMRVLCILAIGVLLGEGRHHTRWSENVRNDNCDKCPFFLGQIGSAVGAFLEATRGFSYQLCQLDPATSEKCLKVSKSAVGIGKSINAFLFPEPDQNVTRSLPCSHMIPICPDRGWEGRVLPKNKWSCESCRSFMKNLIMVFNTTLNEINTKAPSYFCNGVEESDCHAQFTNMINLSGAMSSIFSGERTISDMCRRTMECSI